MSGYRLVAVEKNGNVVAANIWGKLKTVTQMIAIIVMFIDKYSFIEFTHTNMQIPNLVINCLGSIMMIISVIATIFSGWQYIKNGKDVLLNDV